MSPNPAAVKVVHRVIDCGLTIGVAESLTGGLLTSALVDVPGASAAVRGGVVAYSTDLKNTLLGVSKKLLISRGAVDPDVALAMAHGVRVRLGTSIGVATTGVAGPSEQDNIPVGTVYVSVITPEGSEVVERHFGRGRALIRSAAVVAALELLDELTALSASSG